MNLIIVESPTKAKTINKFLGNKYKVESSFGHVRDLPKSEMGIDMDNNFLPKYIIPVKSKKTISNLKKLAEKADKVVLASDEDREGEAIAWHLVEALKLKNDKIKRIVFHEITKEAIEKALINPRNLNMDLVDAQQARRILDRLVGYELSPFLWKKVAKGLSAGRVQSVAVRLIVEREREIRKFKADEYWTIEALLKTTDKKQATEFLARLNKINNKTLGKLQVKNKEEAEKILNALQSAEYRVASIEKKQGKRNAPAPFTTSTLQQTANRWLGFSAKQTMTLAQKLYETGLITYMRTDSLNLSDKFLADAENFLKNSFGKNYSSPKKFKTKSKGAQEAHEAIRPTEAAGAPENLKDKIDDSGQYKLYKLIWQRALASQMPEAIFDNTTVDIDALGTGQFPVPKEKYQFRSNGQILKFDGYLKVYPEKNKEIELPDLAKNEILDLIKLKNNQHFTKPPARYSDAGLVKELEQYGIGRPSTYAPTIATIIERNYAARDENKRLKPNDIAFVVIDLLIAHFPQIVDYQFTAEMEKGFDDIAQGGIKWQPVIKNFYEPFHENLKNKYNEVMKNDIMPEEKSGEVCDKCGAPMIIKIGRYGKFLACSAFPECKNIKGMNGSQNENGEDEKIKELEEKYKDEICDKCGAPMKVKNGRYGPFLSCSTYPKCKNIKNIAGGKNSTGITCPKCGKGEIIQKRGRRGIFYACSAYPDCKNAYWSRPTGGKCPTCQSLLITGKNDTVKCSNKECDYSA
jgi:DNA topoisomerase-1